MKIFFGMLGILLITTSTLTFAKQASDKPIDRDQLALNLLGKSLTGRDGSYEVAKTFAECWGMYDALADYIDKIDGLSEMSVNLRNTGNGAEAAAGYFWRMHSENPRLAMQGISKGSKDYYAAILSVGGVSDKIMTDKMNHCADLTKLQAIVLDDIRKNDYQ